jgi:hypothetical protein
MDVKVNRIEFKYDLGDVSYMVCHLANNCKFDIEPYDFYHWLIENVDSLKNYSDKFHTWSELTEDLKSLEFDFILYSENYINSEFSDSDISMFCYN